MEIRFGQYIIHDNNENGTLDAGVDVITEDENFSSVARQQSDYYPKGGILLDDNPSPITQWEADKFMRKLGVDINTQTPMYDLKDLAISYNWEKAMEFAEAGEIDALQKALLSAQVYSEQAGLGFDFELANEWFAYGAQVCYEKNLDAAEHAAKLGNFGTIEKALENTKGICTLLSCEEKSVDTYFEYYLKVGRIRSVRKGLDEAKAIAETDPYTALQVLGRVKTIATVEFAEKEIKSIADQAIATLLFWADDAINNCKIRQAEKLLHAVIEFQAQFSVKMPEKKISNLKMAIAKCHAEMAAAAAGASSKSARSPGITF